MAPHSIDVSSAGREEAKQPDGHSVQSRTSRSASVNGLVTEEEDLKVSESLHSINILIVNKQLEINIFSLFSSCLCFFLGAREERRDRQTDQREREREREKYCSIDRYRHM